MPFQPFTFGAGANYSFGMDHAFSPLPVETSPGAGAKMTFSKEVFPRGAETSAGTSAGGGLLA